VGDAGSGQGVVVCGGGLGGGGGLLCVVGEGRARSNNQKMTRRLTQESRTKKKRTPYCDRHPVVDLCSGLGMAQLSRGGTAGPEPVLPAN